jgi:hypothetical protein
MNWGQLAAHPNERPLPNRFRGSRVSHRRETRSCRRADFDHERVFVRRSLRSELPEPADRCSPPSESFPIAIRGRRHSELRRPNRRQAFHAQKKRRRTAVGTRRDITVWRRADTGGEDPTSWLTTHLLALHPQWEQCQDTTPEPPHQYRSVHEFLQRSLPESGSQPFS